jgi:hypothetical protein
MMMTLAVKLALTGALVFFMTGLLTGVWKYRCIMASADATAPYYVDIAHRASLQYAFASILLAVLAGYSVFPQAVNAAAMIVVLFFFAFAIITYLVHGYLRDTDNQLRQPHVLGKSVIAGGMMRLSMSLLILGEIGGSAVIGLGAMVGIWGG